MDGIHLDYIRYPESWNIKVSREKGRKFITRIVESIHRSVKREKPWVKMSCSPIGKFDDLGRYWSHGWNAYTKVCQDAQGWLKSGLMDELYPMMYFRNEQFFPFAIDWAEQSYGKIVVPGLGIYFLDPKEGKWKIGDITSEMYHCAISDWDMLFSVTSSCLTTDRVSMISHPRNLISILLWCRL